MSPLSHLQSSDKGLHIPGRWWNRPRPKPSLSQHNRNFLGKPRDAQVFWGRALRRGPAAQDFADCFQASKGTCRSGSCSPVPTLVPTFSLPCFSEALPTSPPAHIITKCPSAAAKRHSTRSLPGPWRQRQPRCVLHATFTSGEGCVLPVVSRPAVSQPPLHSSLGGAVRDAGRCQQRSDLGNGENISPGACAGLREEGPTDVRTIIFPSHLRPITVSVWGCWAHSGSGPGQLKNRSGFPFKQNNQ